MFEEILNNASNKASEYQSSDDYVKDGLIYCNNCNTPKQTVIRLLGQDKTVFCLCMCQSLKVEEEENRHKQIQQEYINKQKSDSCFDDKSLKTKVFETTEKGTIIYKIAYNYAKKFEDMIKNNMGLILHGERGTGKTHISACIANSVLSQSYSVYMTKLSVLMSKMQENYSENKLHLLNKINDVDLFILDDMGTERHTETAMELIFDIIDKRYLSKKPIIISTNLTQDEFTSNENTQYRRIFDRAIENCTFVKSDIKNQRADKAAINKMDLLKILKGE